MDCCKRFFLGIIRTSYQESFYKSHLDPADVCAGCRNYIRSGHGFWLVRRTNISCQREEMGRRCGSTGSSAFSSPPVLGYQYMEKKELPAPCELPAPKEPPPRYLELSHDNRVGPCEIVRTS